MHRLRSSNPDHRPGRPEFPAPTGPESQIGLFLVAGSFEFVGRFEENG
jgi:hypothetical protein